MEDQQLRIETYIEHFDHLERLRNAPPLPPSALDPTASLQDHLELFTRRLKEAEAEVLTAEAGVEDHFFSRDPTESSQSRQSDLEILTQRLEEAEVEVTRAEAEMEGHRAGFTHFMNYRGLDIFIPNTDLPPREEPEEEEEEEEEEEDVSSMPPLEQIQTDGMFFTSSMSPPIEHARFYSTDEDDPDFRRSANITVEQLPAIVNYMPAHVKTIYLNAKAKEAVPDACPVCLEPFDFEDHKSIWVTLCGHLLHTSCHYWLPMREQNKCVVCRADYKQ